MDILTLWFSGIAALGAIGAVIAGIATWFFAARAENRAVESRDIIWRADRTDEGFAFSHDSLTPAKDVLIVLTVRGAASMQRADRILRNANIEIPSDEHRDLVAQSAAQDAKYERDLREYEARASQLSSKWGPGNTGFAPIPPSMGARVNVSAIIVWRYPSGASDRQELAWTETY